MPSHGPQTMDVELEEKEPPRSRSPWIQKKESKCHSPVHFQAKAPQKSGRKNLTYILLLRSVVPEMVFGFVFMTHFKY